MRALVRSASCHGLRLATGGTREVPPVGEPYPRPSGIRQDPRRRGYHRSPGARPGQRRRHGHRRGRPRSALQSTGSLHRGPLHLRLGERWRPGGRISSEAGSEAGHLRLGKLIVLYADNHITIEGSTELAFTEDRMARFAAFGWHVQRIEQSNDIDAIAAALEAAREETGRPSLIQVRTHIGFGSPHKQDTAAAHGEPLGLEEVRLTKEGLGWPVEPPFH